MKAQRQVTRDVEGGLAPQRVIDSHGGRVVGVLVDLPLTAILECNVHKGRSAVMNMHIEGLFRT